MFGRKKEKDLVELYKYLKNNDFDFIVRTYNGVTWTFQSRDISSVVEGTKDRKNYLQVVTQQILTREVKDINKSSDERRAIILKLKEAGVTFAEIKEVMGWDK